MPLPVKPAVLAPLSATTYKIQFTADQETHDKLRHAQALLRHRIPSGDIGALINKALTMLIADVERKKFGIVQRPRATTSAKEAGASHPGSRTIPAAVRRAVAARDGGRCAFVGRDGRCDERDFLEFHHIVPYAAGGKATVDNIALRCRAHNGHEAVLYFGEEAPPRPARTDPG
ncbi:MAG: HNH endonuclease [Vicinamibacterales bacterium]